MSGHLVQIYTSGYSLARSQKLQQLLTITRKKRAICPQNSPVFWHQNDLSLRELTVGVNDINEQGLDELFEYNSNVHQYNIRAAIKNNMHVTRQQHRSFSYLGTSPCMEPPLNYT